MSHDAANAYLTLPADYARALGGLHWSRGCDAIEPADGPTLALVHQLGAVLEGVFAGPAVPPFIFVLHALQVMKFGSKTGPVALDRLKDAYTAAGSAGSGRTAGLLIAELLRDLPPAANPPTLPQLDLAIKRRLLFGEWHRQELAEIPPLSPAEFERHLALRLLQYDDAALATWLRTGGPPAGSGAKLAAELVALPHGVGAVLDAARTRPRLVGATVLVPALDAALTFPPRRPSPDRLPQGGYADVTTRGDPGRLLPSQFALDPDEFVRRFAERELLYFRREEPHRPAAPERWLVVDQGVRAWGPVRLGLAAAVLALLGRDPRKAGDVRLSLTSANLPVTPAELTPDELAARLEASDLTANPSPALLRAFTADFPGGPPTGRDVVLLTHPRALRDADVIQAARLCGPADRLFALAVDDAGRASLTHWAATGPVELRRFRVDLAAAEAAKVPEPARPPVPVDAWAGDVEPVPFPFRAGLVSDAAVLGFDHGGEWLVIVGRDGCVHAKPLGGGPVEVLPRAYHNGDVLTKVEAVVGLNGGVAVCGRLLPRIPGPMVVAHYDFAVRVVRLYVSPVSFDANWFAFPDLQCVAAYRRTRVVGTDVVALDVATGTWFPSGPNSGSGLTTRARIAVARADTDSPSPLRVPLEHASLEEHSDRPFAYLNDGKLWFERWPRPWSFLRPVSDGKPIFVGEDVKDPWIGYERCVLAGDVLAIQSRVVNRSSRILLLRGPAGDVLGEMPAGGKDIPMTLSPDGRWFALRTGTRVVLARETLPGGRVTDASSGGFHNRLTFTIEPHRLRVRIGRFAHTFALNEVPFRYDPCDLLPGPTVAHTPAGYGTSDVAYDPKRFADSVRAGPWVAAFDKWGQIVLMTAAGRLVMGVTVRRELAAAWLPDGTRGGAAALLGGPPSPNAATKIGLALQAASEGYSWK